MRGRRLVGWLAFLGLLIAARGAPEYPTFGLDALRRDFDQFRALLETRHPHHFTDRVALAAAFGEQRTRLRAGMNELEFLRVLAPLIRELNCGHSRVSLSSATESATAANRRFVPFDGRVIDDRMFVIAASVGAPLVPGDEILAINDRSWSAIQATLYDRIPSDGFNTSLKRNRLNYEFATVYDRYVETADDYTLKFRRRSDGEILTATLPGLSPTAWDDLTPPWWARDLEVGSYDFASDHAYLYVKSFNFYDAAAHARFETFIDGFFTQLAGRGIDKLILDVRGNGGGDPYMGAYLLSYLIDQPVTYFAANSDFYNDLKDPVQPKANAFRGQLMTLIDGGGFSTNGHFCSLLKYHHIGELVGYETGGAGTTTSNNVDFTLNESRIRLSLATNTFTTATSGLPYGRGIMPDHPVEPTLDDYLSGFDVEKAYALRELEVAMEPVVITVPPSATVVRSGGRVALLVRAEGSGPLAYQWRKDGVLLPGETSPLLPLPDFSLEDVGSYDVWVRGPLNRETSGPVALTVGDPLGAGTERLVNLASRGHLPPGPARMIAGFVIAGTESRQMLIRGIGPGLARLDLDGVVERPTLSLYRGDTLIATNTDWQEGDADLLRSVFARLGAFALDGADADNALLMQLEPGLYSAHLWSANAAGGVGLIEIYDAEADEGGARPLINLSTQGTVSGSQNILVASLVIGGEAQQTVLIRGVGPGLREHGEPNGLDRPHLTLSAGGQPLMTNAGWSDDPNAAAIAAVAKQVGAFPLAPGSADCAMLVTLPPGVYTVEARAPEGASGRVLAEVYTVPE